MIRDVSSGTRIWIVPFRILDPGSRVIKTPDPGSWIRIRNTEIKIKLDSESYPVCTLRKEGTVPVPTKGEYRNIGQ
jgi:hypothetical protein